MTAEYLDSERRNRCPVSGGFYRPGALARWRRWVRPTGRWEKCIFHAARKKNGQVSPNSGCARIPQSGGGRRPAAWPATWPAGLDGWLSRPASPIQGMARPDFRRGWPLGWPLGWPPGWPPGQPAGQPAGWVASRLAGWPARWPVGQPADLPASLLAAVRPASRPPSRAASPGPAQGQPRGQPAGRRGRATLFGEVASHFGKNGWPDFGPAQPGGQPVWRGGSARFGGWLSPILRVARPDWGGGSARFGGWLAGWPAGQPPTR